MGTGKRVVLEGIYFPEQGVLFATTFTSPLMGLLKNTGPKPLSKHLSYTSNMC